MSSIFEIDILVENEFISDQEELAHWLLGQNKPVILSAESSMVDVVMLIPGMFKSRTDARKNGWEGKEIPNGMSDWVVGKKKWRIWIFKPMKMNPKESGGR